ncbi:integrase arm-type DNA-binding domain-containing protein [Pasteurella caecimuris]|uniref:integrase arm-type DNA-binding domain-containing protein n=1 Tax=Rodentibacter caecimuris TaxID=1796644 RepID=UPI00214FD73A|nr:integrase arm-type DNA-binding domain-containing protein [Pasteurella caecimuris]MCR1837757.1 integrase arm-type DNA-binding domain-containing protein [Pasteurella caecimuris]MCU0106466.1 integrase arm-type DNA-binding domain-containing protein [Pasteurella caecimuris]
MARTTKPLSNTQIEKAKPKEKGYTLSDGQGLYLLIKPTGAKLWRFNYYKPITKKRTEISLGAFPTVQLAEARTIREEYRALLAQGIDPQIHHQQKLQAKLDDFNNTYESIAWAWFEYRKTKKNFSLDYQKDVESLIKRNLLPHFGHLPISQITAPLALKAFKQYQDEGKLEKLKRTIQKHNEIMTYALHRDIISVNPTANTSKEFDSPTVKHFKTIKPEDLSEFIYTLNHAQIHLQTRYLILWQLLTMTRPNEAATARYEDIDETTRLWTIYIQKGIKESDKGRIHKITLSRQALALLREIKKLSGGKTYLFPSVKNPQTHVNTQTANAAIKRMGYAGKLVAHGLRSIASTYLNEQGYDSELIEVALSHMKSDRIKAAYDRGERLEQRFKLLQVWGDFIEKCSQGALPKHHLQMVV